MKLNGITCIKYTEHTDSFTAVLSNTTQEDILAITAGYLQITTDEGSAVKTYTRFNGAQSIEQNFATGLFTATFPQFTGNEQQLAALQQTVQALQVINTKLNAQIKANEQSTAFLEECIVEMAGVVYA